jgi:hypothetical protein
MKLTRSSHLPACTGAAALILLLAPAVGAAQQASQLQFRRPSVGNQTAPAATSAPLAFRSVRVAAPGAESVATPAKSAAAVQQAAHQAPVKPLPAPRRQEAAAPVASQPARSAAAGTTQVRKITTPAVDLQPAPQVRRAAPPSLGPAIDANPLREGVSQANYYGDECVECDPGCGVYDPGCGICDPCCDEPVCGCAEPICGCDEPACGCAEPMCGCVGGCDSCEAACGCAEPECGMVSCGSCVGNPGPDYWCFPVCLPRLKEMTIWGGAHGFKGPRDYLDGGPGDNNFGFQEGLNIGGRAPLVGLIVPQLSYQLGYQAVQSRLSGTSGGRDDRNQHFVTAGFFRRVRSGVQGGIVWDMMRDDLLMEEDFHQLRYEVSLKSANGREIGYWGASSTNSKEVGAFDYESVEQHAAFFRLNFRDGGALRIWGGATGDSEGIVGADFLAPLSNRWSVTTGFNYLIPDATDGPNGAREESWNVGLNLVWHWGATAKAGSRNPHAPLFPVADNGWMFIDAVH